VKKSGKKNSTFFARFFVKIKKKSFQKWKKKIFFQSFFIFVFVLK